MLSQHGQINLLDSIHVCTPRLITLSPQPISMSGRNFESCSETPMGPPPDQSDSLCNWVPGMASGPAVRKVMEGKINPFTKRPHSGRYKNILRTRKKLPVFTQMDEFLKVYNENQVVVVVGETGSGKTTQIPQFVTYSNLPFVRGRAVACTQPRRVATTSVANRVAKEMDVRIGKEVGYSIRFENVTEEGTTFLKYMTDGVLLREAMGDPSLERYSTIILDEAHERSIATDILMAFLKGLVQQRRDLKIIVMSATLDAIKFQEYFSNQSNTHVPLFKVPGHTHSIEIFNTIAPEPSYFAAAIEKVLSIHQTERPGDILLFLTGKIEIEYACQKIKLKADDLMIHNPATVGPLTCIPLYSSLPPQQQQCIFGPAPASRFPDGPTGRKVIVATNIAETSLTIDGIVYVVDPGFSKQEGYNPQTQADSLLVKRISKASAQQRAGRAGRTAPGKCFRLYTECQFMEMEEQTPPEILMNSLGHTVLQLIKLGVKDPVLFNYVDAPPLEAIRCAIELLYSLGALDEDGNLTQLGDMMAQFPLDPQLSKVAIISPQFMCSDEILTIAAMLSVPDVWLNPIDRRQEARAAWALLTKPEGAHFTLLNVYNQYVQNKHNGEWAWTNYLSLRSLQEAERIRAQLSPIMEQFGLAIHSTPKQKKLLANIQKALVCGFFMQVARKKGPGKYLTEHNQVVLLHPSSHLNAPEWVIYNDLITLDGGRYIKTASSIKAEWLVDLAAKYFDISPVPTGEIAKRQALHLVWDKRTKNSVANAGATKKKDKGKNKTNEKGKGKEETKKKAKDLKRTKKTSKGK